jgi:membrane-bound ClpP family serine protease
MFKTMGSYKIIVRYSLFQLPAMALMIGLLYLVRRWVDIPLWFHWGIIIVWIAKDIILFPLVWRAYDWDHESDGNPMIGLQGIALETIDPSGYILVRGERWHVEIQGKGPPIEKGQPVKVQGMKGLTLFVQPVETGIDP